MKRLQLLSIFLVLTTLSFGQQDNQSEGLVTQSITNQQFTGTFPNAPEIFRFKSGLVTQLDLESPTNDTLFNFGDSRWFSIGRLQTSANQTVYGLRFQLPNRALTYGYQDIDDDDPRIQWIDDREEPGNLDFRFADSFSSTSSTLVAKMTNESQLILPEVNAISVTIPEDDKLSVQNRNYRNGINVSTNFITSPNGRALGIGVNASSGFNDNNVAVRGTVNGGFGINGTNIAIEGIASVSGGFAGFFNGDVTVTGTFTNPSDRDLKEDVELTRNALEKISGLKSYTYKFKENENLNLPQGLQYGLISQELEKTYPSLVHETTYPIYDKDGNFVAQGTYKSVNYIGLISELTGAIKELNTKVETLEEKLETRVVYSSKFSASELEKINKNAYQLQQNIPNPFSDSTIISYALPENQTQASILIFDLNGRMLKSYDVKNRKGELTINAGDLNGAGMYLYTLFANGVEVITKRMILK